MAKAPRTSSAKTAAPATANGRVAANRAAGGTRFTRRAASKRTAWRGRSQGSGAGVRRTARTRPRQGAHPDGNRRTRSRCRRRLGAGSAILVGAIRGSESRRCCSKVVCALAGTGSVYISGEEAAEQVRMRANRLGLTGDARAPRHRHQCARCADRLR